MNDGKRRATRPNPLRVKRVYAAPDEGDGLRVLVDRLWPRGLTKQKARVDLWLKDVAPSDDLRRHFHGDPTQWAAFNAAYAGELARAPALPLADSIIEKLAAGPVTLLYAARDDTLGALAERTGLEQSTLSRNLRTLERQGLVEIAVAEGDLRRRAVWLTEQGARRLEAALPVWREAHEALARSLDPGLAARLAELSRNL